MGLVSSSVVREHQRTRPMTSTLAHGRVQGEGLCCGTTGSWDSGQRSRTTHKESRGKAYIEGQWEAGTRVYRSRKEA